MKGATISTLRLTPQVLEKSRIVANFEDEANSKQLDKEDTQRSNLYSKYLNLALAVEYPDSFICFYNKLTCEVQIDIALRSPSKRSFIRVSS